MSLKEGKIEISDALMLGYLSVITYVISIAKELGYLNYFKIPSYFMNLDIYENMNSLLLIGFVLILTYFTNKFAFDMSDKFFEKMVLKGSFTTSMVVKMIAFKLIIPFVVPYLVYWFDVKDMTNSIIQMVLYIGITLIITLAILVIELQLLRNGHIHDEKILRVIVFNIVWLLSNFILFWSFGSLYAKYNRRHLTFNDGKSVVVYFSNNKMFTKSTIGDSVLSANHEFSVFNLDDSTYHFKSILLK